jgi:hypothetical protein
MFKNLDFIHIGICYGFLKESNHQEYSVLFVAVCDEFRVLALVVKCSRDIIVQISLILRSTLYDRPRPFKVEANSTQMAMKLRKS